jgi:hypothetical protein
MRNNHSGGVLFCFLFFVFASRSDSSCSFSPCSVFCWLFAMFSLAILLAFFVVLIVPTLSDHNAVCAVDTRTLCVLCVCVCVACVNALCMYVRVHISVHVCVDVCGCVCLFCVCLLCVMPVLCVCMVYIYMCMCACGVCVRLCISVDTHFRDVVACTYVCTCVCVCTCVYACVCVCVRI